jgi:signal transduction histidine kinase
MRCSRFKTVLARVACGWMAAVCLCAPCAHAGPAPDVKKVLVLFPEESFSAPAYRMIYGALKEVFDRTVKAEATLFGESLDLYLFPDSAAQRNLAAFIGSKYARTNIDLLIPVAPSSLGFVLRLRESIFPGVPVVYCGELAHRGRRLEHRGDVTGTALILEIAGTIELARQLRPGLRRIAVVAGTGMIDEYMLALFHDAFNSVKGDLELIELVGLPLEHLLNKASALPDASAILFVGFQRDGSGKIFSSAGTLKLLAQAANAPIFNFIDTALGYGSVGGRMTQIETMARKTAEIALRVISGESIAAIEPVVIRENPAMFDWRELKRWGIDESVLPPGSIVRFKELSTWEEYRWWVIGTLAFICFLFLLVSVLVNSLLKRRKAERAVATARQELSHVTRVSTVGGLAQGLSHEINQPLMAIQTNAEAARNLMEAERPDLFEVREALDDIVVNNRRAQAVVRRIRQMVEKKPMVFARVDLNQVASSAAEVVQAYAGQKEVDLRLDLDPGLSRVRGDQVQLQQVALNLIVNAVEAAGDDRAAVRLVGIKTAGGGDRRVRLLVSDTGAGIAPQFMERVFEPFFTTKPQGLGLGLSISRTIAEAHGGTLGVSANPDGGATFCLDLPAAEKSGRPGRAGGGVPYDRQQP